MLAWKPSARHPVNTFLLFGVDAVDHAEHPRAQNLLIDVCLLARLETVGCDLDRLLMLKNTRRGAPL